MGGLQFFDQNGVKILEVGYFGNGWTTKEFIIDENERIFDVVSTSKLSRVQPIQVLNMTFSS